MNELNEKLVNIINGFLDRVSWSEIEVVFSINQGAIGFIVSYLDNKNMMQDLAISTKHLGFYLDYLHPLFLEKVNDINKRFNRLQVKIFPDGTYKEKYYWDEEKEKEDKLTAAKYFYQWTNDTMMNRIFDYEKENNLLTPNYDEEGDLIDYQESWDNGVFTFTIKDNTISHQIILFKNNIERNLPMPLPQYFKEDLLEHYKITNNELKENWKPWNKLVIKSPHNSIPYDEWEDYVTYSLEENDRY